MTITILTDAEFTQEIERINKMQQEALTMLDANKAKEASIALDNLIDLHLIDIACNREVSQ